MRPRAPRPRVVSLIAVDPLGRQRAAATFRRSWRWNEVTDCREYGYRLVVYEGCDFGSLEWFHRLPTGRAGWGVPAEWTWRLA